MGWYVANFSAANSMNWLRDIGCTVDKRCTDWGERAGGAFCTGLPTDNKPEMCTHNHAGFGYCNTQTLTKNIDPYYQYFSDPKIAGGNSLTDYCPYIQKSNDQGCLNAVSAIENTALSGEFYGTNSRCFQSSAYSTSSQGFGQSTARCFETRCITGNKYQFRVGATDWYTCNFDGEIVSGLNGFKGNVTCPRIIIICPVTGVLPPTPVTPVTNSTANSTNPVVKPTNSTSNSTNPSTNSTSNSTNPKTSTTPKTSSKVVSDATQVFKWASLVALLIALLVFNL